MGYVISRIHVRITGTDLAEDLLGLNERVTPLLRSAGLVVLLSLLWGVIIYLALIAVV